MEANTENHSTENVKPVSRYLGSVYSTMTLGDVSISRRFAEVDKNTNTDPEAENRETIEISYRVKLGKTWFVITADHITNRRSQYVATYVRIGSEAIDRKFNTEKKKIETIPDCFNMDINQVQVSVSYGRLYSYFKYDLVEETDVVGVSDLARLMNVPTKTAAELIRLVDQVRKYANQYISPRDEEEA